METELLRDFLMLTEYRNYSAAADQLYISQSTLSKRIKRLEEQVGTPLFDRTTKTVELNEMGQTFQTYAKQMLDLESQCLATLHEMLPAASSRLVIGAIPSLAKYQLTDLISSFIKETKVNVQVVTAPSEKLEVMLQSEACDAAFIRQVQDPDNLFLKREITRNRLVVILPEDHELARFDQLEIKQLKKENFVLLPEGSRPYETCLYLCKKNGFAPNIVFTDAKVSNIIDFIQKGMGISLLMGKNILDHQSDGIKAIPVFPYVEQSVQLCLLRKKRTALQKRFLTFVEGSLAERKNEV